jgi:hypothetical protein
MTITTIHFQRLCALPNSDLKKRKMFRPELLFSIVRCIFFQKRKNVFDGACPNGFRIFEVCSRLYGLHGRGFELLSRTIANDQYHDEEALSPNTIILTRT